MKAVTICSQLFYPELISTGQTLTELAEALTEKGCKVQVICGQPTLQSREKIEKHLEYKGIQIRRIWSTQFSKLNLWGKLLNHLSFTVSMGIALATDHETHPLIVLTNPPFLLVVASLVAKLKKRPLIVVLFDVYPETAIACGFLKKNGVLSWLWHRANQMAFHYAQSIVVLGRCMETVIYTQLSPKDQPKLKRIPIWADDTRIQAGLASTFRKEWGLGSAFVALYSGNMGRFHDMETILLAAKALKDHPEIQFVFVGDGHKRALVEARIHEWQLTNCQIHPYVRREQLPDLLRMANVGLVSLMPQQVGFSVPSKTFGLLSAGVPVVAIMPKEAEIAKVLTEHNCGWVIDNNNANALAQVLIRLAADPQALYSVQVNARETVNRFFTVSQAADRYLDLLND